jgi:putative serine protease PepD
VVVLLAAASWLIWRLDSRNAELAAGLATERDRAAALTGRTERLEKQLAGVFDPEAISSAVLPSVFRVRAGDFTGTAFAVGDRAAAGKANLLTNFHVVESVWKSGSRKVTLERGGDEVAATIVKVSRGKDLALLRADRDIKGLSPGRADVKPGQQILVVGAPLGLEDTVTTGVVSAYRPDDEDGQSIQFDASINPGNSGGPVVNAADEVVGVATAKARDAEGIGLAVSIRTACDTFDVC